MIANALIEQSLNHLLRQTPGAAEGLQRHAGQTLRFDLIMQSLDYRIADDGYLSETALPQTSKPDAVIRPTSALFTRLPFAGREALREADYSGDPQLLTSLDRVFKHLAWDVEADLASLVGDAAAHRLAAGGRAGLAWLTQAGRALAQNLAEYSIEEAGLMARKVDVERFNREVDTLADDVARLEARLRLLESTRRA